MKSFAGAAIALIAAVFLVAQSVSANEDVRPYVRPQQLVDVGNGRHLNLYCSGSGGPTIVLDAGFGVGAYDWHKLQPALASHVRTCFYERAGYGFSDPGTRPQDTSAIVDDMHAMLHNAHVPGPYVLVAHSLAGFDARLYADRYRPEVAGMVLITPSEEDADDRFDAIYGRAKVAAFDAMVVKTLTMCSMQAHQHKIKVGGKCLRPDPSHPAEVQRARLKLALAPGQWDAMLSEWSNDKTDNSEIKAEQRDYGQLPLIVLTAGNEADDAKDQSTPKQLAQSMIALKQMRAADASHSELGVSCIVPGVHGEFIQDQRMQAVVNATLDVVHEAQAGASAKAVACHY